MLKSILLVLVLAIIALTSSGCATILGGIIGYQSGELAAGLAIGAAVDFGDDIVRGIGQMTAKQENLRRDFLEKSDFDSERGEITLPINPFNQQRVGEITQKLQNKFIENGWDWRRTKKSTHSGLLSPDRWEEKWAVVTEEGVPFSFEIDYVSDRDTRLHVRTLGHWPLDWSDGEEGQNPPSLTPEQMAQITSRIYQWMEQIVLAAP